MILGINTEQQRLRTQEKNRITCLGGHPYVFAKKSIHITGFAQLICRSWQGHLAAHLHRQS